MGFDIQQYYTLHQSLTLEDLAKANSRHTLKGLVRVVNKVKKKELTIRFLFLIVQSELYAFLEQVCNCLRGPHSE
jgi:hypothetical protein